MGRQDMLKLAAYNRLRKVASAARVIRQNRAMQKAAGDFEAPSIDELKGMSIGDLIAYLSKQEPDPAKVKEMLKKIRNRGYITAGVLPGVATAGGGITGYGLGRLIGGRTGGLVGAAGGAGLGLGLSALPGIGAGVIGGVAGKALREMDSEGKPAGGKPKTT